MEILELEPFGTEALLSALKRTRLRGHGQAEIYAQAELSLWRAAPTDALAPAQRYVLTPGVQRTLALREALLTRGIDIFALDGGVWVRTAAHPDERIPVIPPIVEDSHEPDGRVVWIVNDGMHRIYAARMLGLPITVVRAKGVPPIYPYYAFALPGGWSDVIEIDALPETFEKKAYRDPENYKALFRDFNAVFPGVQAQRAKSNPDRLRA